VACHVIHVGTCHPNWHNQPWAGSSVAKCILIVTVEGQEFKFLKKQIFFGPNQINIMHRSPCGVLEESLESGMTSAILGLVYMYSLGIP
jgi:hypothetical protein